MNAKFYICRRCGNLVEMIHDVGVPVFCCGQKMEPLVPNTVDASGEKHLPVVTVADGVVTVNVGSADHPMLPEHFIEWVYVETENGGQRKALKPGDSRFLLHRQRQARCSICLLQSPRSVDDGSIS